jgi:hypothetical protein
MTIIVKKTYYKEKQKKNITAQIGTPGCIAGLLVISQFASGRSCYRPT